LEGTSFASPQAAGAAALLAGSGVTDPNAQKAVLINSARQGRATPAQAMGTQTGWQPDWGWGAIDLQAALAERTSFVDSEVPGGGARFFRASGVGAADRATLVWYRRAWSACHTGRCAPQPMTLTNLDLEQLDPATGAVQAQSTSTIDNVEQVRAPAGTPSAIYKVRAASSVDGLPAEPFAITARRPLTPLATPQPAVTLDVDADRQRPGQTATVTATVRNPSPDLTAENAQLALALPAGVELVAGAPTRTLGTLPTASPASTFTWTVRGTADGLKQISAEASASRYGETFTGSADDEYLVDGSGPAPTIAVPGGETTTTRLDVSWGADDASPVTGYDIDVSIDGAPWTPWLAGTQDTRAGFDGAAGHRYRFRVRATDSLGNTGAYVESGETSIAEPASTTTEPGQTPPPPPPGKPKRRDARIAVASTRRGRTTLTIGGRSDRDASGRVSAVYAVKSGRKTIRAKATDRIRNGVFKLTIKLPSGARRVRRGTLTLTYSGDVFYAPATLRRTITTR
ncbi:MAG: serine protease AprX, partial [Thermoleophilaceae bacterium]|nr:serine protease AprX [Thermoleophilaceae bacterium]